MGKYEILPCGAFYEVFFIQASKSTKFAFISKYQFIELTIRVNAYINFAQKNKINAYINYLQLCINYLY